MNDPKRSPYRQPAPADGQGSRRGRVVQRAPDPETDAPTRRNFERSPAPPIVSDPDAGVFSGLLSAHPASSAGERAGQWALSLVALPLILSTLVAIGWLDTRAAANAVRRGDVVSPPLGIAHPFAWLFGAALLVFAVFVTRTPPVTLVGWVGVPFVALLVRRSLRSRIVERETLETMRRKRR